MLPGGVGTTRRESGTLSGRKRQVPAQARRPVALVVGPLEADLLRLRLGRINVAEILDDVHPRHGARAMDEHLEPHGSLRHELVAHEMVAGALAGSQSESCR